MHTLARPCARRAAALLLLLPTVAMAQDDAVAEAEREAATQVRAAAQATDEARRALEAYGAGPSGASSSRAELRVRGLERLSGPLAPDPVGPPPPERVEPRPERDEAFDPAAALEELTTIREAVLARLRRLAPERYGDALEEDVQQPPLEPRSYPIQDLLATPEDGLAPLPTVDIHGLSGPGDGGGGVLTFEDDRNPPLVGVGMSLDLLVELLEAELADAPSVSLEPSPTHLVVQARPAEHARVEALLARLREPRAGLVELEAQIFVMPPAVFGRLNAGSGLDAAAEAALAAALESGEVRARGSERLVIRDGERVVLHRGGSRSFLADIDVDPAGGAPVLRPVVRALNEGLLLELRPIVDRARGRALIELALTLCESEGQAERREVHGLELELPRIAIASTSSTSCVSLGRTVLLGGVLAPEGAEPGLAAVVALRTRLIQGR